MYGGTFSILSKFATGTGLSPRVRGHLFSLDADTEYEGSIPACTGAPLDEQQDDDDRTVYPRVCGGTLVVSRHHVYLRSIPACAGAP